jgi:hypothetical protein
MRVKVEPNRVIGLRLPAALAQQIEQTAARELLSVSAWSRRVLLRAIESAEARNG